MRRRRRRAQIQARRRPRPSHGQSPRPADRHTKRRHHRHVCCPPRRCRNSVTCRSRATDCALTLFSPVYPPFIECAASMRKLLKWHCAVVMHHSGEAVGEVSTPKCRPQEPYTDLPLGPGSGAHCGRLPAVGAAPATAASRCGFFRQRAGRRLGAFVRRRAAQRLHGDVGRLP